MAHLISGPYPVGALLLSTLIYVDLSLFIDSATVQSVDAGWSLPAGATLEDVVLDVGTAVVLASATAVSIKVGTSGDDDAYLTSTSLLATGRTAAAGAVGTRTPATDTALKIKITADVDLGDDEVTLISAGKVGLRINYRLDQRMFA
jgi:hypothetical protein